MRCTICDCKLSIKGIVRIFLMWGTVSVLPTVVKAGKLSYLAFSIRGLGLFIKHSGLQPRMLRPNDATELPFLNRCCRYTALWSSNIFSRHPFECFCTQEQYHQLNGPRNVRYMAVFFDSGQMEVNKSHLDSWTLLTKASEAALTLFTVFQSVQHG